MTTVETMTFDGGAECLDFVNSGYDLQQGVVTERLHNYGDLLRLAERITLFDAYTLHKLKQQATENEQDAEKALKAAQEIRTLLYLLFAGLAQGSQNKLGDQPLSQLNDLFSKAFPFRPLVLQNGQLHFSFQPEAAGLMAPVWRFILSTYDLLNAGNLHQIKQCQRCAWLFFDETKNHRKKWCSMESCGNRQKTKRYYEKKKLV